MWRNQGPLQPQCQPPLMLGVMSLSFSRLWHLMSQDWWKAKEGKTSIKKLITQRQTKTTIMMMKHQEGSKIEDCLAKNSILRVTKWRQCKHQCNIHSWSPNCVLRHWGNATDSRGTTSHCKFLKETSNICRTLCKLLLLCCLDLIT